MPELRPDALAEIFGLIIDAQKDPAAGRVGQIGGWLWPRHGARGRAPRDHRLRLPDEKWPAQPLVITAVNAEYRGASHLRRIVGRVADRRSGSELCRAGHLAPVTIEGQQYIDGGVYSATNADLVEGHTGHRASPGGHWAECSGRRTDRCHGIGRGPLAIAADARSLSAFGPNLLDPASRDAALDAGMLQADPVVAVVRQYWTEAATSTGDHSSQPANQS